MENLKKFHKVHSKIRKYFTEMAEKIILQNIRWTNYQSIIFEAQKAIFENPDEFDCAIVTSDKKILKAHKVILSSSSDFFYKMLKDVPVAEIPTIYIPDSDGVVLDSLMAFIYTGEASIAAGLLTKMLDLCDFLEIKGYISCDCSINGTKLQQKIDPNDESNATCLQYDETEDDDEEHEADDNNEYVVIEEKDFPDDEIAIEYLEDFDALEDEYTVDHNDIKDEEIDIEISQISEDEGDSKVTITDRSRNKDRKFRSEAYRKDMEFELEMAFSQIATGKTLHQISHEFNVPRSTLYQKFRNNHLLKSSYRKERRSALEQAVRCVIEERLSLKKASDRYNIPKTAIWRELRKTNQYHPPGKELAPERQQAQNEIILGRSLTSISSKYGIPLTTLHRDKKRLSLEGKLPEAYMVKDRTENSDYSKRLEQALDLCSKGFSQYQAAKLCNIPKATMWRRANALRSQQEVKKETTLDSPKSTVEWNTKYEQNQT